MIRPWAAAHAHAGRQSMIPKSVQRFSEKIMLNRKLEWDDDASHPALAKSETTE
jgi:hypothetical protein